MNGVVSRTRRSFNGGYVVVGIDASLTEADAGRLAEPGAKPFVRLTLTLLPLAYSRRSGRTRWHEVETWEGVVWLGDDDGPPLVFDPPLAAEGKPLLIHNRFEVFEWVKRKAVRKLFGV